MDSQSKGQGQGSAFASAAFAVDSAGNAGVRDLRSLLLRVPGVVTSDGGVHTRGADAEVAVPATTRHRGSALLPQLRVAFVHSPADGCWATDGVLAGTVRQRSSGSGDGVDGVAPLRWQRERGLGKRFALACRHSHTGASPCQRWLAFHPPGVVAAVCWSWCGLHNPRPYCGSSGSSPAAMSCLRVRG